MLAYDDLGSGAPLLLLHGTPSSRREWLAVLEPLAAQRRVIAVDLPGFGESAPIEGAVVPADWVAPIGELLDALDVGRCAVVGSSMGGWTALEVARAGRATAVLALSPAGLWSRESPRLVNAQLRLNRALGHLTPRGVTRRMLQTPSLRRRILRQLSVDAAKVPAEWAVALVEGTDAATGWPSHYHAVKRERFTGGREIDVPVRVLWGARDPIAPARKSRHTDQLPAHVVVETWPDCAHQLSWDATDAVVSAALALSH